MTTLVTFNGVNGAVPAGDLISDALGNLYGTTFGGGYLLNQSNPDVRRFFQDLVRHLTAAIGTDRIYPKLHEAIAAFEETIKR